MKLIKHPKLQKYFSKVGKKGFIYVNLTMITKANRSIFSSDISQQNLWKKRGVIFDNKKDNNSYE
jgi:hypothetical protein